MSTITATFPFDLTIGSGTSLRQWAGAITWTRDSSTQIVTASVEGARVSGTVNGGFYVEFPAGTIPAELQPEIDNYPYVADVSWGINPDGSGYAYLPGTGDLAASAFRYVTDAPIVLDPPVPNTPPASSVLGELRRELADDIAGQPVELTVYDHVPARVQLPAAFVMAGGPYVEQGDTFGSSIVRFSVVLLTQPSLSSDETDQLDERIESVQRRLLSAGWTVERVERPEIQELNGAELLATALSVACSATFP